MAAAYKNVTSTGAQTATFTQSVNNSRTTQVMAFEVLLPVITVQPVQQSVASGTATFSVTATGTGSLSYLWYKNGASTGTTTASYTTPTVTNADNGHRYYCEVTDSIGTTTTATVFLFIIGASSADGDKINSAWFTR
jgi:hypothetical protein